MVVRCLVSIWSVNQPTMRQSSLLNDASANRRYVVDRKIVATEKLERRSVECLHFFVSMFLSNVLLGVASESGSERAWNVRLAMRRTTPNLVSLSTIASIAAAALAARFVSLIALCSALGDSSCVTNSR